MELPNEIYENILEYSDLKTLERFSQTSLEMYDLSKRIKTRREKRDEDKNRSIVNNYVDILKFSEEFSLDVRHDKLDELVLILNDYSEEFNLEKIYIYINRLDVDFVINLEEIEDLFCIKLYATVGEGVVLLNSTLSGLILRSPEFLYKLIDYDVLLKDF